MLNSDKGKGKKKKTWPMIVRLTNKVRGKKRNRTAKKKEKRRGERRYSA